MLYSSIPGYNSKTVKTGKNRQNYNLPLGTLARLDRVLRSAARLVGGLSKFSSITAYMRDVLHWLPISERIQYRITAMVSRCVLGCAPSYLRVLCCPVSVLAAR